MNRQRNQVMCSFSIGMPDDSVKLLKMAMQVTGKLSKNTKNNYLREDSQGKNKLCQIHRNGTQLPYQTAPCLHLPKSTEKSWFKKEA